MNARLLDLIRDYQRSVRLAVDLLVRSGVELPKSNVAWTAMDLKNGEFISGHSMFKHGFGCSVKGPDVTVDFDFANAGETNRFDIGRLQAFASRRSDLFGFRSLDEIRLAYDDATNQGEVAVDVDGLGYLRDAG